MLVRGTFIFDVWDRAHYSSLLLLLCCCCYSRTWVHIGRNRVLEATELKLLDKRNASSDDDDDDDVDDDDDDDGYNNVYNSDGYNNCDYDLDDNIVDDDADGPTYDCLRLYDRLIVDIG